MPMVRDPQIALSQGDLSDIRSFYEDYYSALEQADFSKWPDFFDEDGYYTVQSASGRRNGFLICDIFCDGKAMIRDRAAALRSTTVYEERFLRYFIGQLRIASSDAAKYEVETSYLAVESVVDEPPAIFSVGRTFDVVKKNGGQLLFTRREVVYDHSSIRNSLVFPL